MKHKRWLYGVMALVLIVWVALGAVSCRKEAQVFEPQAAVRERIAIDAREDSFIYNGADIRLYSDDHSTETGRLDSAGGWQVAAPTAIATATPALSVSSKGVSNILEIQDASTPVARFEDGGNFDMISGVFQPSFANLTVSNGDTITPTYTIYALDTSGAVTITLAASADEGQLLLLINDDANATIIADTNLRSSDGNAITLAGAYDVALFVYQDSEWLLIASSANS